jgi:hypothetical protein
MFMLTVSTSTATPQPGDPRRSDTAPDVHWQRRIPDAIRSRDTFINRQVALAAVDQAVNSQPLGSR